MCVTPFFYLLSCSFFFTLDRRGKGSPGPLFFPSVVLQAVVEAPFSCAPPFFFSGAADNRRRLFAVQRLDTGAARLFFFPCAFFMSSI